MKLSRDNETICIASSPPSSAGEKPDGFVVLYSRYTTS